MIGYKIEAKVDSVDIELKPFSEKIKVEGAVDIYGNPVEAFVEKNSLKKISMIKHGQITVNFLQLSFVWHKNYGHGNLAANESESTITLFGWTGSKESMEKILQEFSSFLFMAFGKKVEF